MKKIRLSILGSSEIAFRKFLPALINSDKFEYVGVASRTNDKVKKFYENYGGIIFDTYEDAIMSDNVDAVYIPLPPSLHFKWAEKALQNNKHILLEKPFTTDIRETEILIDSAKKSNLAVHENYMFMFHNQIKEIENIIKSNVLGEIKLIRASFGFPFRGAGDFRYNNSLGGGALLDCGGYPIKLATHLLSGEVKVTTSNLYVNKKYNVDTYGSVTLENDNGQVAQIAFGMDNSYKCQLEIWGSKGELIAPRVFTAPPDLNPQIVITIQGEKQVIEVNRDDQFYKSIEEFYNLITNPSSRVEKFNEILKQSYIVDVVKNKARRCNYE